MRRWAPSLWAPSHSGCDTERCNALEPWRRTELLEDLLRLGAQRLELVGATGDGEKLGLLEQNHPEVEGGSHRPEELLGLAEPGKSRRDVEACQTSAEAQRVRSQE